MGKTTINGHFQIAFCMLTRPGNHPFSQALVKQIHLQPAAISCFTGVVEPLVHQDFTGPVELRYQMPYLVGTL